MSFFPDLTPLNNKITEFSQVQSQQQKEMIALLRTISQQLAEISQQIKPIKLCPSKQLKTNT